MSPSSWTRRKSEGDEQTEQQQDMQRAKTCHPGGVAAAAASSRPLAVSYGLAGDAAPAGLEVVEEGIAEVAGS